MWLLWATFVCFTTVYCYGDARGEVDTLVVTQYGPVRGQVFPVYNGRFAETVIAWLAIPYAEPPTGPLRFAPAVEVSPWVEVLEAVTAGPMCPQSLVFGAAESEDCLTVDVYAPYDTSSGPYPVMVWIHGGSYQSGGSAGYPGHFLASHGVVVVVIQYRLGNLGFLYTGDDAVTPNLGMYDQQEALRWVQTTIAAFGGDPDHVTIFGESSGASSVGLHMTAPSSQGLFHQAMMESGNDMVEWAILNPNSPPELYTQQLADSVGCLNNDTHAMVACLRTKPYAQIERFTVDCTDGYDCLGLQPVIDGPGGFIPDWPRLLREAGQSSAVPTLHGINRDEGSMYIWLWYISDPYITEGVDRSNFTAILSNLLQRYRGGMSDAMFDVMFRQFDFVYAPWPDVNEDTMGNLEALNELSTDFWYGSPCDYLSKLQQQVAPVYHYVFDYKSENSNLPEWTGIPHGWELEYVWGDPLLQLNQNVQNASGNEPGIDFTVDDIKFTAYFQELITNFAKYGDPSPEPVLNPNGYGDTVWAPYTWDDMNYLYLQSKPYMGKQWRQTEYALTQYLLPVTVGYYFDTSATGENDFPNNGTTNRHRDAPLSRQMAMEAQLFREQFVKRQEI